MALQLSLTNLQQNNCADWIFTDSTGEYSATNTTGWATSTSGGTNLRIDNSVVLVAELIIAFPTSSEVAEQTIDLITNWEDLTGLTNVAFDSSTTPSTVEYTLNSSDLFGIESFPDGIYTITYRVGDAATYDTSTVRSTVTYTIASYCNIECCIEQYLALVPDNYTCEECSNDYLEKTMILWTLLQALKMSACLADTSRFTAILSTLQDACSDSGSSCCE